VAKVSIDLEVSDKKAWERIPAVPFEFPGDNIEVEEESYIKDSRLCRKVFIVVDDPQKSAQIARWIRTGSHLP